MKYETVIFDLDGTLLNTLEDIKDACNHALASYGFPPRTLEEVQSFIGNGILNLMRRAVPAGTDEETAQKTFQAFIPYYQEHCMDRTRPYDGIPELIQELHEKGIKTAVVSNKADPAVQKLIPYYFGDLFDAVAGEKKGIRKKPAPDTVYTVMNALQANPEKTVYIGDSDVDIETAKNAGIPCISVAWGFRDKDFLVEHGASVLADRVSDLENLLFFF